MIDLKKITEELDITETMLAGMLDMTHRTLLRAVGKHEFAYTDAFNLAKVYSLITMIKMMNLHKVPVNSRLSLLQNNDSKEEYTPLFYIIEQPYHAHISRFRNYCVDFMKDISE